MTFYSQTYVWFFVFIWFDASNKEWLAGIQGIHQSIKRFLKLCPQCGRFPPGVLASGDVLRKQHLQELYLRGLDERDEIWTEGVSILVQET